MGMRREGGREGGAVEIVHQDTISTEEKSGAHDDLITNNRFYYCQWTSAMR